MFQEAGNGWIIGELITHYQIRSIIYQIYMLAGRTRIGISNGQIPGNKNTFPEAFQLKSRLHYYSTLFNSIEVNSCFYKTPLRKTYEKWVKDVPPDFQFTLKLSKEVTHSKELRYEIDCLDQFLKSATGAGSKKGCLLIQFPGKISLEHFTQLEQLLADISERDPESEWRKAIEFRNESWYVGETKELLDEYSATMVVHDFAKAPLSSVSTKAPFVYLRYHGPTGNYRNSYSHLQLEEQAKKMDEYVSSGKDVYAYFNNTAGGAFENARYLVQYLSLNSNNNVL